MTRPRGRYLCLSSWQPAVGVLFFPSSKLRFLEVTSKEEGTTYPWQPSRPRDI